MSRACRVHEQKYIDWDERLNILLEDIEIYRNHVVMNVNRRIGGKDSYYQVHFVKENLDSILFWLLITATII